MSAPEIRQMLCLSIAHISEETNDMLEHLLGGGDPLVGLYEPIAIGGAYDEAGFCLFVPQPEDIKHGTPPELIAIYDLARLLGCKNVLLDKDADGIEGLKLFDW
jgi:hypothetical protein